jgi:glycosyltransferase involved in cell wall biosynthesis
MYCGSCMRDNALAGALERLGHQVVLAPLFTPLRTDTPNHGASQVFYGGINVYLQHATKFFRRTPRLFDWLLDRRWLLKTAAGFGADKPPAELGALTLDILRGEEGHEVKELRRLMDFLVSTARPDVVSLPNLMFIGVARLLGRELRLPVVCELTGEDIFLDAMNDRDRASARQIIRERVGDVSRFVATSHDYARRMADYLGIAPGRIDVVYPGIPRAYIDGVAGPRSGVGDGGGATEAGTQPVSATPEAAEAGTQPVSAAPRPFTRADGSPAGGGLSVGYLARICPEKGLDRLIDAMILLRAKPGMEQVKLKIAGYMSKGNRDWYKAQCQRAQNSALAGAMEYAGEVDLDGKRRFLDSLDVFSVPTAYPESKGIYVIEALAHGVPVVQPDHGSFGELIGRTGGGVLVAAGDAAALAEALAQLLRDAARRRALGAAGRAAVLASFTDEAMARGMMGVYERAIEQSRRL